MKGPPLFQDKLRRTPFWMLVACVLVNRTRWSQAEPVLKRLRGAYGGPLGLAGARRSDVAREVRALGLHVARSDRLVRLAQAWLGWRRARLRVTAEVVELMPGCGRYAADSYAIFVEGRTDVAPLDKELIKHVRGER